MSDSDFFGGKPKPKKEFDDDFFKDAPASKPAVSLTPAVSTTKKSEVKKATFDDDYMSK